MALFQPTNVTPSAFGELGNGVVDASNNLVVSWQVNGNSAMTAFSIAIYKNDAASTQIYSTGKLTSGCPFYGVDGAGNMKLFNYSIPASTLSGLTAWGNGNEYKLVITQYWEETVTSGGSTSDVEKSVVQTSASAFITREEPVVTLGSSSSYVTSIIATFTAVYYQAQGDAPNWVRWVLTDADGATVKDTGNIYGTAELSFTYNGFISGKRYKIRCLAQTENGVTADSGETSFLVYYSTSPISGQATASVLPSFSGAKVTWPAARSISGTGSGTYTLIDSVINMESGSSVSWSTDTGKAMDLTNPWTIVWRGFADGLTTSSQLFNANSGALVLKPRALQDGESPLAWVAAKTPVGFTGYASSVAYGNGVFVAVESSTTSGGAASSPCARSTDDGLTWSVASMPKASWARVCYGNGVFVAISDSMAAYSTDSGNTWTSASIPNTFSKMTDIAYGNGYFVCTSASGNDVIYSSNNGKTWTQGSISGATGGFRVVYGSNKFLAVNIYSNKNYYSADGGKNWTYAASTATTGMQSVTYSGSYFMATDSSDPTKFYRSTNGTGWATYTATGAPDDAIMNVAYGNGKFLAWDASGKMSDLLLYSENNGATWDTASFGYSSRRTSIAYGGVRFVAVGGGFDASFQTQGFALTKSGTTILQPLAAKTTELIFVCSQDAAGKIALSVGYVNNGSSLRTGVMSWSKDSTVLDITKLAMTGPQLCDYLLVLYGTEYAGRFTDYPNYHPQFDSNTQFFADFVENLDAGPLGSSQTVSSVLVFRQKEGDATLTLVAKMPSNSREMVDCSARSQETVRYLIYSVFGTGSSTSILTTDYVTPCFWDWALISCKTDEDGICHPQEIFKFGKNLSTGAVSNNGGANLLKNFTRYPTAQTLPYNYASGSLTSLIGSTAAGVYSDTRELRDAIYAVTENADAVFLKSRKGDLYKVVISGSISMSTMDNTCQQAQTATIPWTEIASADGEQIVITETDKMWDSVEDDDIWLE